MLLLLLFRGVVLLLTLLALLTLLPSGLLLLLLFPGGIILRLTILALLILLSLGWRLLLRFSLLLLFRGLGLFVLFFLPCKSWSSDSNKQKKRRRADNSNPFHYATSITSICASVTGHRGRVYSHA